MTIMVGKGLILDCYEIIYCHEIIWVTPKFYYLWIYCSAILQREVGATNTLWIIVTNWRPFPKISFTLCSLTPSQARSNTCDVCSFSLIGQRCREISSWHVCRYKYRAPHFWYAALFLWGKMYRLGQQSISKSFFNSFLSTVPREDFQFTRHYNKSWSCIGWFLIKSLQEFARKCQGPRRRTAKVSVRTAAMLLALLVWLLFAGGICSSSFSLVVLYAM